MATLGELLSGDSKQNLLSTVQRGDVIRMEMTSEEGVKPKNAGDESRTNTSLFSAKRQTGN